MPPSMQHWNGDQMCAIDCETTGLRAGYHEIIQIAILPLDSNIQPRRDVMPFCMSFKLDHPERIDVEAIAVNKADIAKLMLQGYDKEKAKDLFEQWFEKLELPYAKYGNFRKRILPLGQNYGFDKNFIIDWMGQEMYDQFFDGRHRDTLTASLYCNDRAAMHNNTVPYSKNNLKYLASTMKVETNQLHDALEDCKVTAEVYRKMLQMGVLG